MVNKEIWSNEELDKVLQTYAETFKNGLLTFDEEPIPEGTSGFWNSHYIDKLTTNIELIMKSLQHVEDA